MYPNTQLYQRRDEQNVYIRMQPISWVASPHITGNEIASERMTRHHDDYVQNVQVGGRG